MAAGVENFDAHAIPEAHVLRDGDTSFRDLDGATLGDARRADDLIVRIGYRARADDRARAQIA